MKIVHVSIGTGPAVFTSHGGAIQRRVAELAQAQLQRDHEVVVFSPGPTTGKQERNGVQVNYVTTRAPSPWTHLEYQIKATAGIRRAHRDADVIHFHSEPEGALLARGLPGTTALSYDNYYFRGGRDSRLYPVYQRALKAFDILLPCSHYCERSSREYWRLPDGSTRVLFNGVNVEQFRPNREAAAAERAQVGADGNVLLYLGRVCEQKGTDLLLAAFAKVRRTLPDTTLVIAGPIDQFGTKANRREEASWLNRMRQAQATYLGAVHEQRLTGLLNLADVFVMPTRELEMFGMAAIEAQACGTPVVASNHGGLQEVVPDEAGRRFACGDVEALAAQLEELLRDDELRGRLGRGALANARRYAWEQVAAEFDAIHGGAPVAEDAGVG